MENIKAKIERVESGQSRISKINLLVLELNREHLKASAGYHNGMSPSGCVDIDKGLMVEMLTSQVVLIEKEISGDVKFIEAIELMITK